MCGRLICPVAQEREANLASRVAAEAQQRQERSAALQELAASLQETETTELLLLLILSGISLE